MKLGLGLNRHRLTPENFRFAAQAGCTHVVVHCVDYARAPAPGVPERLRGYAMAGNPAEIWSVAELSAIRRQAEAEGLMVAAVENLDPAHWSDVLLDGPRRAPQIAKLKALVRNLGTAGIPCLGYYFSLAGTAGRLEGPFARGGGISLKMDQTATNPVPAGVVWNMTYDPAAGPGFQYATSAEALWDRLRCFLDEILPVAEEAGVTLAAHPDDPPVPELQSTPRLVYRPEAYQRLIDLSPSPRHCVEFCVGTTAEMAEGDVYETTDRLSRAGRIGYVHFRNVRGKAPHYCETFIDDGDVDMARVLGILKRNGFNGVLIPDHAPLMSCDAPWHAGMAFALGYMRALLQKV
jgi:mannonate dehydratase